MGATATTTTVCNVFSFFVLPICISTQHSTRFFQSLTLSICETTRALVSRRRVVFDVFLSPSGSRIQFRGKDKTKTLNEFSPTCSHLPSPFLAR